MHRLFTEGAEGERRQLGDIQGRALMTGICFITDQTGKYLFNFPEVSNLREVIKKSV
jgi:hypothetical protein